jgi:S-adenosylmethionine synthetase
MAQKSWLFTSESVSEGHPDKVCDRISDTVLDLYMAADPDARVACEVLATTDHVTIAGEVRGPDAVLALVEDAARAAIRDIGYEQKGFDWRTAEVIIRLHAQSADIAQGVDVGGKAEEGAGDQGIMFGYACDETEELMPAPIQFSHRILRLMAEARKSGAEPRFGPDAKSQVTLRYEAGRPVAVDAVLVSTQHAEDVDQETVRAIVEPFVHRALPQGWEIPEGRLFVNPTGRFVIGGPDGDTGLTGRKIIVDTYGGAARMAAAPSRARTRPRSTARPPTPRATSPRTWSPRACRGSASSRSPTRSACRSRWRFMSTPSARARSTRPSSAGSCAIRCG